VERPSDPSATDPEVASAAPRATIGWIKPGAVDETITRLFELLPDGVGVSVLTTLWSLSMTNRDRFDAAAFDAKRPEILEAARGLVEYAPIDVLAVTGDLLLGAMGPAWNEDVRVAVEREIATPTVTGMTAVTDALRHLGATRVAIASPYADGKTRHLRDYLEASGFDVVAAIGHPNVTGKAFKRLPADEPYVTATRAMAAAPGADALYLPSPAWNSTAYVERIEREQGVPVVTMKGSMVWSCLTRIGWPEGRTGFGRLLAEIGAATPPPP
jgi:maleate cis-trans isomerase